MKFKGLYALQSSVGYLLRNSESPSFWTFTFRERLSAKEAMRLWSRTANDLTRHLGWQSLRVAELHPLGHGIHIHAITPRRYDIDDVKLYAQRNGFGRINVKRIKISDGTCERVARYLSKYLAKSPSAGKGVRLWGINGGLDYVRVKDVVCSGDGVDDFKSFMATHGGDYFSKLVAYERHQLCGNR